MSKNKKEKVFITADTHFFHKNIIGYCDRPFYSVKEMNEKLIFNWNKVVSKSSTIFHLGDVSFASKKETQNVIQKLHGRKVLILGNHDRHKGIDWWMEIGFDEVYKYPTIINKHVVLQHEPSEFYTSRTPYIWLYGHVHNSEMYKTITATSACMCVERWEYKPIELDVVLNLIKKEKEVSVEPKD